MRWQTISEARWILLVVLLPLLAGLYWRQHWLTGLAVLLLIFVLWFFRDPERAIPPDDAIVVSAADGVVADIVDIEENEVTKKKARRVGIFLNVFDVHVNRAPVGGKVVHSVRHVGKFLDARHADASTLNEARTWAFDSPRAGVIVVRQITGLIARRIVDWSQVGDTVDKGHRFGMIRFGSRTEIYLPPDADLQVKVGDRVVGGESVVARLR